MQIKQAPAEVEEVATPKNLIEVFLSVNIYIFIKLFAFYVLSFALFFILVTFLFYI